MPKRILILGSTGVDKGRVLEILKEHLDIGFAPTQKIDFFDFEKDFISLFVEEFHSYLDGSESQQRECWLKAWREMSSRLSNDSNFVLSMHATLARPLFTNRSPVLINEISLLGFTNIITLIDDVFDKWARTESRAAKKAAPLQPSMADLLETRRAETVLGDVIANNISTDQHQVTNFLVAVKHPQETLVNLLKGEKPTKKRIYVSHPISDPRRYAEDGDNSKIGEINSWLNKVSKADSLATDAVFFYPLTIDELPLRKLVTDENDGGGTSITFERNITWNLRDFFDDRKLICDYDSLPQELELDKDNLSLISGMLKSDVRFRDLRLVSQSRRLLVLCPWYHDRRPRGVRDEIDYATKNGNVVHIWQDPKHDSNGECKSTYIKDSGGTFGAVRDLVYVHDTIEKAIERVLAD